ncbi:HEAT repeat domain-containing protein [Virgisporangium aurantiacum]|uniref:HEAT repeat-containing protein n=1 Tax=Virgisporangium aurantiacum TaxID=175570 RepID=A0A8J4E0U7_9ACTN|nr:HEAT repeat domain-containing protein [Virgisporangium aurantiacum]GIJ57191.1 hypothetical protein Vau01_047070 [Virgisporangium aurantiacum]
MTWFTATVVTDDGEIPLRDLPVGEVVSAALTAGPDDGWQYVSFLHLRGDRETFDAARALCRSDEPARRALGADILAQLGAVTVTSAEETASVPVEQRPFRAASITLLLDVIADETDETVLPSVIGALGHLGDPHAVGPIARHREHPDVEVRWMVVQSLTHFADEDDAALAHLIEMTADPARRIRDWSCFGLYQTGRDTPEVREALLARTDDTDPVTRGEALRALAALEDPRAVEPLRAALAAPANPADDPSGESAALLEEAREHLAGYMTDPR